MERTQIYLSANQSAALERAARETGLTKSQLIRDAIDEKYGTKPSLEEFLAVLDAAFGAWREEPGQDRSAYLKQMRRAGARRLARLDRLRRTPAEQPDAPDHR